MANKTALIETRILNGQYESAKTARTAVTRSKLHGRVKKRLHAIIDTWPDGKAVKTLDITPEDQPDADPPQAPVAKLPMMSIYGKTGASHIKQDPLDRCAMLLLVYAVKNKVSMQAAFSELQKRIEGIAIDG